VTALLQGLAGVLFTMLMVYPPDTQAFLGMKVPEIAGPAWINSEPKSLNDLRGKVVLVEFWTFGCYNCWNVEPQIKKWHQNYAGQGLVVLGVHSPEWAYENHYWPAIYLIDKRGIIRYIRIGEGGYTETEKTIKRLLTEPR